jgi:hypothetical protein
MFTQKPGFAILEYDELVFIKEPVACVSSPGFPAHLVACDGGGVVQRYYDHGAFDLFEEGGIFGRSGEEEGAVGGPVVPVVRCEGSDSDWVGGFACE